MRRIILVAIVAFISTAPIAAAVVQQVVTPAEAEQMLAQTSTPSPSASAPDKAMVQTIIQGQIDAFRHDDGAAAYSYAAPNIRRVFPTAGQFMTMVQSAYAPVYRPRSVHFGSLEQADGHWVQRVDIVGPDGDYYTAAYMIEAQPDGSWKITGCMLIKAPGTSA